MAMGQIEAVRQSGSGIMCCGGLDDGDGAERSNGAEHGGMAELSLMLARGGGWCRKQSSNVTVVRDGQRAGLADVACKTYKEVTRAR